SRLIAGLEPGAAASIEVIRDGRRQLVSVPVIERHETAVVASLPPPTRTELKLGLDVQDLTPELAERFKLKETRGALVAKVDQGSVAQLEGLREGDLIKEVNRREVANVTDFTAALARIKRHETILLRVLREARAFYVVLKPADK
ncbi:MAG TPA: PDZ domain-containing protein, partial [Nitrospirales bacterium]|nr:PDZ domain-containing protein [Nitrospirales bacterium]